MKKCLSSLLILSLFFNSVPVFGMRALFDGFAKGFKGYVRDHIFESEIVQDQEGQYSQELYGEIEEEYDSDCSDSAVTIVSAQEELGLADCRKLCGDVVFCKIFLFADLETFKRLRLAFCNKRKYQAIFDRILFDFDPRRFDSGSSREIIWYKDLKFSEISKQAQELRERIKKEGVVRVVFKKGDSAEIKLLDENNVENELYDMLKYEDPILLDALRNIVKHETIIKRGKRLIIGGYLGGYLGGGVGLAIATVVRLIGFGTVNKAFLVGTPVGGIVGAIVGAIVGDVIEDVNFTFVCYSWGIWDCINGCYSSRKRKLEKRLREAIYTKQKLQ